MSDAKPTNPKDLIGSKKLPLGVVPDVVPIYAALGHVEGAFKYGASNWVDAGVRCMIYVDALERHIKKFKAGEWRDQKSQVPHLANALACIGIILDAHHRGVIVDDRPPAAPHVIALIDAAAASLAHLRETFADPAVKHYTILDANPDTPKGRLVGAPTDGSP